MAFRKRNVAIGRAPSTPSDVDGADVQNATGIRPSPLTSHPVTSTGTLSLDDQLGGHGGLPLGSSLLIEESGTTDFAGALLRYYAAEGICHNHIVHVVGVGEGEDIVLDVGIGDLLERAKEGVRPEELRFPQAGWYIAASMLAWTAFWELTARNHENPYSQVLARLVVFVAVWVATSV